MAKCGSKIRSIVWLRQTLRRWRSRAAARAAAEAVPAGHVAVCVGGAARRFVVRAAHLNHPVFRELLRQAEEEYGFPTCAGPVALPCVDERLFEHVLRHLSSSNKAARYVTLDDIVRSAAALSCCCAGDALPLLHHHHGIAADKAVW